MLTPEPTISDIVLAKACALREAAPGKYTVASSIEKVYDDEPQLWERQQREMAHGGLVRPDPIETLTKIADALEHQQNPCVEISKRVFALRASDPALSETAAIEVVFKQDPDLYARYRTRNVHRHPFVALPENATEYPDPEAVIQKALNAGESLDSIVERHPGAWDAARQQQRARRRSEFAQGR